MDDSTDAAGNALLHSSGAARRRTASANQGTRAPLCPGVDRRGQESGRKGPRPDCHGYRFPSDPSRRPIFSISMQRNLTTLARESFDLLIIGGGIFGAGIARDAALRGLKVALVERADFAS